MRGGVGGWQLHALLQGPRRQRFPRSSSLPPARPPSRPPAFPPSRLLSLPSPPSLPLSSLTGRKVTNGPVNGREGWSRDAVLVPCQASSRGGRSPPTRKTSPSTPPTPAASTSGSLPSLPPALLSQVLVSQYPPLHYPPLPSLLPSIHPSIHPSIPHPPSEYEDRAQAHRELWSGSVERRREFRVEG